MGSKSQASFVPLRRSCGFSPCTSLRGLESSSVAVGVQNGMSHEESGNMSAFNLVQGEQGESQSTNNNAVTTEYWLDKGKCDRLHTGTCLAFCATKIVVSLSASDDVSVVSFKQVKIVASHVDADKVINLDYPGLFNNVSVTYMILYSIKG